MDSRDAFKERLDRLEQNIDKLQKILELDMMLEKMELAQLEREAAANAD